MKYVIPLAAILVMGIAAGVHPAFVGPAGSDRRLPMPPKVRLQPCDPEPASRKEETALALSEVPQRVTLPTAISPTKRSSETAWRKVYAQLAQDVALTAIQQTAIEQILRDRDDEIRSYHDQMRATGVVDLRQFEWQTMLMKDGWFRKIDAHLDRVQHEQFMVLVQKGFLNAGLDFTVEPGMTVID